MRSLALAFAASTRCARLHRGQHEVVVVAGIDLELLKIEVGDVRAHLVQEMPVVADDDHGGVVVVERTLEPADRVDVEVVGGLIQQQHIGPARTTPAPAARAASSPAAPRASGRCGATRGMPASVRMAAGARLGVVAAVLGEHPLELGRLHVIRVGGVGVGVDPVALLSSPATARRGRASPHRARAHPRSRTGSDSACRAACPVCSMTSPALGSSSPPRTLHERGFTASRSRRSGHSDCRRRI